MSNNEPFVDPYLDPASGLLRNKPGISDREDLARVEARLVATRAQELHVHPDLVEQTWDAEHWKGIHRHLFQDVYDWVGEFRTVDIAKNERTFHPGQFIERAVEYVAGQLQAIVALEDPSIDQLAEPLALALGDMNETHPFREGNGRTQREMIGQVAAHHGHPIDWETISAEDNIEASNASLAEPAAFAPLLHNAMISAATNNEVNDDGMWLLHNDAPSAQHAPVVGTHHIEPGVDRDVDDGISRDRSTSLGPDEVGV